MRKSFFHASMNMVFACEVVNFHIKNNPVLLKAGRGRPVLKEKKRKLVFL